MPNTNSPEIRRRELVIFYVLDTSGSMINDGKISVLNEAMKETTYVLQDIAKTNAEAEIKVAIMEFNSGAHWITKHGPVYLEDFIWDDLTAGGLTDIGVALGELQDKMTRHKFLKSDTGQYIPVVIFMSDGYPTDNWNKALKELKDNNQWFNHATKVAFALGNDADEKVLANIVGNREAVVKTNDMELFRKLIQFVSVAASMVIIESRTEGQSYSGADILKQYAEGVVNPEDKTDIIDSFDGDKGNNWDDLDLNEFI